jgi:hypothetical protein
MKDISKCKSYSEKGKIEMKEKIDEFLKFINH